MTNTYKLTLTGLMTAAVTVATMAIMIPVPNTGGYIHAGDSMVFLSVLILGWRYGAFAAGVGSALADVLSGYMLWAPSTLVIKTLMAVLMGLAIEKAMKSKRNTVILSVVVAGSWILFNLVTMMIVKNKALTNPANLASDGGNVSQVAALVGKMETQMMVVSLIIPILLVAVTLLIRKKEKVILPTYHLLAITLAGFWMVFGYFVAGGIMYGNFAVSALSIPMNIIQFGVGFFLAELIWAGLKSFHLSPVQALPKQ